LEAFTGESYWIEARAASEGDIAKGGFHSGRRKIVVTDNVKDLKVVLSEKGYFGTGCRDKK
ncbi:MAG TPA: hypothetical protein VE863_03065, partial [Pyrinomonadaceae bacterium]|nr:hypothetical protein [Pyrinomonadaceae bacterium]